MQLSPVVQPPYTKNGYAAITSMLVLLAIITIIGTTVAIMGIGNAQMSLGESRGESALFLVESCIADTLIYYNQYGTIPTTRNLPSGSCTNNIITSTATTATFITQATLSTYTKKIQVTANRGSGVQVVNYTQID